MSDVRSETPEKQKLSSTSQIILMLQNRIDRVNRLEGINQPTGNTLLSLSALDVRAAHIVNEFRELYQATDEWTTRIKNDISVLESEIPKQPATKAVALNAQLKDQVALLDQAGTEISELSKNKERFKQKYKKIVQRLEEIAVENQDPKKLFENVQEKTKLDLDLAELDKIKNTYRIQQQPIIMKWEEIHAKIQETVRGLSITLAESLNKKLGPDDLKSQRQEL